MSDASSEASRTSPPSTVDRVAAMLGRMVPDPEQPAAVEGEWRYTPLVEGTLDAGVWSATAASWDETDYPVDEVMVMVSGHLRLTDAGGTTHDLRRGDMFHLPRGWAGCWEVIEDMQKIYVILP